MLVSPCAAYFQFWLYSIWCLWVCLFKFPLSSCTTSRWVYNDTYNDIYNIICNPLSVFMTDSLAIRWPGWCWTFIITYSDILTWVQTFSNYQLNIHVWDLKSVFHLDSNSFTNTIAIVFAISVYISLFVSIFTAVENPWLCTYPGNKTFHKCFILKLLKFSTLSLSLTLFYVPVFYSPFW